MKQYDIAALGEVLMDMSQFGVSPRGNDIYEANPGGAPCNMMSMAARLGSKCVFIGKVGDDVLGMKLKKKLESQKIDCTGLVMDKRYSTTLAFVHIDENGERSFTFCRKPGADAMLEMKDIRTGCIEDATIFHFGTISSTDVPGREATHYAVSIAERSSCVISFDPNIRYSIWNTNDALMEEVRFGCGNCHILKVSGEELAVIMQDTDVERAAHKLCAKYPKIDLMFATLGDQGCYVLGRNFSFHAGVVHTENVRDTTGAGDSFLGCINHFIAKYSEGRFDKVYVREAVQYGAIASSIIVTKVGSMCAMPTSGDVEKHLSKPGR